MPDDPLLREKAREAIRAGTLPSRRPDGTLGGSGFGGACALCGELLRRDQLELAAVFESRDAAPAPRNSYHFHPLCYLVWEAERTQAEQLARLRRLERLPRPCPSRSSASAPSRSCRRSRASLGHRTESIAGRSLGGARARRS
jgi:hypothetical protein